MCRLRNIAMCEYRTDRQADRQTDAGKLSLCAAMLRRSQNYVRYKQINIHLINLHMRQKNKYASGSVLSVHGLKVGMFPNFYLFSSSRFDQILNLNLLMPIYM